MEDIKKPFGYIYCITNTINGKKYIGQTVKTIGERWNGHKTQARCGAETCLHRAMRKYGFAVFTVEIICEALSREELDALEWSHIASSESDNRLKGYNMVPGGNITHNNQLPRGPMSEETKKKIGDVHRGRVHTETTREKFRLSHLGKTPSEETKEKIRLKWLATAELRAEKRAEKKLLLSLKKKEFRRDNPKLRKPLSEETKRKMSEAASRRVGAARYQFGKTPSEETRAKISKSLTGIKQSEETRKKKSENAKRMWLTRPRMHTEETKALISLKKKGCKHSEESRKKISETWKAKKAEQRRNKELEYARSEA